MVDKADLEAWQQVVLRLVCLKYGKILDSGHAVIQTVTRRRRPLSDLRKNFLRQRVRSGTEQTAVADGLWSVADLWRCTSPDLSSSEKSRRSV